MSLMDDRAEARFLDKIAAESADGCWIWVGARTRTGYGCFAWQGRQRHEAHRLSYRHFVGEVPEGLVLDHLCRTRACVNPSHLEPVTQRENMRRGFYASRTHCVRGHEYTEANTYVNKEGHRYCVECRRMRKRSAYNPAANRAAYDPAARRERYLRTGK